MNDAVNPVRNIKAFKGANITVVTFLFFIIGLIISALNSAVGNMEDTSQAKPLLSDKRQYSDKSYREILSSTASVNGAFRALQLPIHTEIEVIRLLTVIDMITDGWSLSGARAPRGIKLVVNILRSHWSDYADVIISSNCVYCSTGFDVNKELIKEQKVPAKYIDQIIKTSARYLKVVDKHQDIPMDEKLKLVKIFAQLSHNMLYWESDYLLGILAENNDKDILTDPSYQYLYNTVTKQSYNLLSDTEKDTIKKKWIMEVSRGNTTSVKNKDITIMLAGDGYRPALRWIIWLLDEDVSYLLLHQYFRDRLTQDLNLFLSKKTDFIHIKEKTLSQYYTDNWQNISWSESKKKWVTLK